MQLNFPTKSEKELYPFHWALWEGSRKGVILY